MRGAISILVFSMMVIPALQCMAQPTQDDYSIHFNTQLKFILVEVAQDDTGLTWNISDIQNLRLMDDFEQKIIKEITGIDSLYSISSIVGEINRILTAFGGTGGKISNLSALALAGNYSSNGSNLPTDQEGIDNLLRQIQIERCSYNCNSFQAKQTILLVKNKTDGTTWDKALIQIRLNDTNSVDTNSRITDFIKSFPNSKGSGAEGNLRFTLITNSAHLKRVFGIDSVGCFLVKSSEETIGSDELQRENHIWNSESESEVHSRIGLLSLMRSVGLETDNDAVADAANVLLQVMDANLSRMFVAENGLFRLIYVYLDDAEEPSIEYSYSEDDRLHVSEFFLIYSDESEHQESGWWMKAIEHPLTYIGLIASIAVIGILIMKKRGVPS